MPTERGRGDRRRAATRNPIRILKLLRRAWDTLWPPQLGAFAMRRRRPRSRIREACSSPCLTGIRRGAGSTCETRRAPARRALALRSTTAGNVVHIEPRRSPVRRAQQPGTGGDDGRVAGTARVRPFGASFTRAEGQLSRACEGVEPGGGGAGVDEPSGDVVASTPLAAHPRASLRGARAPLRGAGVLARVEQDVTEREAHLARCLQGAGVIAVGEEPAFARE